MKHSYIARMHREFKRQKHVKAEVKAFGTLEQAKSEGPRVTKAEGGLL